MPKSLRSYIETLQKLCPEEVVQVRKEVDPKFEATVFLRKLELEGRSPMAIFPDVKNLYGEKSEVALGFNAFASRKKLAVALDLKPEQYKMEPVLELAKRYRNQGTIEVLNTEDAPVKEVIKKGVDVDLYKLPIPTHHSKDGGPYILGASTAMRSPETGVYNLAMLRLHVKSSKKTTIHAELNHHSGMIIKENRKSGKETPVAIIVGHHPTFYLGSQCEGPYGKDEYEIASAAMGEPLRVVPSETWGNEFMVPADAEMIIEGVVSADEVDEEGPIGEHTRYYKTIRGGKIDKRLDPVVTVTAITYRRNAIYLSNNMAHADQGLIGSLPKEAVIYERAKSCCPGVSAVYLTPGGVCRYICYISLKQRVAGEAKNAIMAAFISDWHIKFTVAVDDDIDIFSDQEVLWAIATRTQPSRNFFVIPDAMGASLDPTVNLESSKPLTSKMGIDATKPYGEPFSEVCEVPLDLLNNMRLEDYI
jgi:2,5-furandicarboxylate decarboxylase 1